MKVMITGAAGQLGRELLACAPAPMQCYPLDRAQLDIADTEAVEQWLHELEPALVINSAAYTAVDKAEEEPDVARRANAAGPAAMAKACVKAGVRLIHLSTDFVFDGHASIPYLPSSATSPLCEYGSSKLAGEQAVLATLPSAVVLRTSWVYSRHGHNFVKTMLRLMRERDSLSVVADQIGAPTWAHGLASACWAAAERDSLAGIYHWSDAGVCSWYDFAVAICEEACALDLLPQPVAIQPITTADYPLPATRPAYSVLDKTDTWCELDLAPVHWRAQLRAMLQDLKENGDG